MHETWKSINQRYEVSSMGRVRSVPISGIDSRGRPRHKTGKMLKACPRGDGYLVVNITGFRHKKNWKVHQLVAIHFLDNPRSLKCINHKNGERQDNRVGNLEWCDHSHNNKHAYEVCGRKPVICKGAANGYSKRVVDSNTGAMYQSLTEASVAMGMKRTTLGAMLTGQSRNKTSLRYL